MCLSEWFLVCMLACSDLCSILIPCARFLLLWLLLCTLTNCQHKTYIQLLTRLQYKTKIDDSCVVYYLRHAADAAMLGVDKTSNFRYR